jgi:hypothetical protein
MFQYFGEVILNSTQFLKAHRFNAILNSITELGLTPNSSKSDFLLYDHTIEVSFVLLLLEKICSILTSGKITVFTLIQL